MDVDLDHAGIGRHLDDVDARVVRRRIAFQADRNSKLGGGRFGSFDQIEIILQPLDRRHEDAELAVAQLDRQGGANRDGGERRRRGRRLGLRHLASRRERALPLRRSVRGTTAVGCLHGQPGRFGQWLTRRERIGRHQMRVVDGCHIGQRAQRQAQPDGRIARRQEQAAAAQFPYLAVPAGLGLRGPALHRQNVAGWLAEMTLERAHDAGTLVGIVDLGIARIHIGGQLALLEHAIGRILEGGLDERGHKPQAFRHAFGEAPGFVIRRWALAGLGRQQVETAPERHAIAAPEQRERPARQRLARIPFSFAIVQKPAGCEAGVQTADQLIGAQPLGRTERIGVPFGRLIVVDGNEGGLAPHGEPDIMGSQIRIDALAERVQCGPGFVGEWQGDAGLLGDPREIHVEPEGNLGGPYQPADRRGRRVMRARGERQMALAAEQAGGRIEPVPAGTRQIDLGPCMQVGEVPLRARGSVERLHVGLELNEITGHKAGREAEVTQDLHQEPGGVAAGTLR